MLDETAPLTADPSTHELIRFPGMVKDGLYPSPIPFGGMGKPIDQDGYSDHSPIAVTVIEKN